MITVVVCTYNRSGHLKSALESLNRQTLDREMFEVIIVDNASTDDTKEVAERFVGSGFRYVYEPQQGLSHARNAGYQAAEGQYVGYLDDDAKADSGWLSNAQRVIDEIRPDIFGGPYYPFYLTEKPDWFLDKYETSTLGDKPRCLADNEYLSGTNIIFRRELLKQLNGFSTNLGMSGASIAYGEETELMIRARAAYSDLKVYYHPEVMVYHLVPEYKMNLRWYLSSYYYCGKCYKNVFKTRHRFPVLRSLAILCLNFFLIIVKLCCGTPFRNRNKYKYIQNYIIEKLLGHVYQTGSAMSILLPGEKR